MCCSPISARETIIRKSHRQEAARALRDRGLSTDAAGSDFAGPTDFTDSVIVRRHDAEIHAPARWARSGRIRTSTSDGWTWSWLSSKRSREEGIIPKQDAAEIQSARIVFGRSHQRDRSGSETRRHRLHDLGGRIRRSCFALLPFRPDFIRCSRYSHGASGCGTRPPSFLKTFSDSSTS